MFAHIGKSDVVSVWVYLAVCSVVNDSNHEAQQSWDSLAIETNKKESQSTGSFVSGDFHGISELVGHVDGHGVHPHEEADKGVVCEVAKENARQGVGVVCFRMEMQTSADTVENEVDGDIAEEANGDLPKQLLSKVSEYQVDSQGQKHEET